MHRRIILTLIILILITGYNQAQKQKRISTHLVTQTLQKGKLVKAEADLYFEFPSGQVLMYSYAPEEFVYISNPIGETRLYKPREKKIIVKASEILTSRNNNLYYFLVNQTYDLGLKELGFTITGSRYEGEVFITSWQAPLHLIDQVNKIDLVHENLLPIYAEYFNTKGETILKVYFDKFVKVYDSRVPALITEIAFMPDGDSLIKRMQYNDYRFGDACDSTKFNLEIPEDVKIIK